VWLAEEIHINNNVIILSNKELQWLVFDTVRFVITKREPSRSQ